MLKIISDDCINCGACAAECPAEAIFEPRQEGKSIGQKFSSVSNEHFYIVPDLCNECINLDEFKCISICPMDAIR